LPQVRCSNANHKGPEISNYYICSTFVAVKSQERPRRT
jgi:hypothetical protein